MTTMCDVVKLLRCSSLPALIVRCTHIIMELHHASNWIRERVGRKRQFKGSPIGLRYDYRQSRRRTDLVVMSRGLNCIEHIPFIQRLLRPELAQISLFVPDMKSVLLSGSILVAAPSRATSTTREFIREWRSACSEWERRHFISESSAI